MKNLELIGDDADFFIIWFSTEFNVDFSDFKFNDYFIEESTIPFYYFYLKYFDKQKIVKQTFTLNHLVQVVEKGVWFDPEN